MYSIPNPDHAIRIRNRIASYTWFHLSFGVQSRPKFHDYFVRHRRIPHSSLRIYVGKLFNKHSMSCAIFIASTSLLTRQRAHFETSVMVGPSGEPMRISSHWSSANGPPPSNTMLGRNLKRWIRLLMLFINLCMSILSSHHSYFWNPPFNREFLILPLLVNILRAYKWSGFLVD